MRMAWVVAAGVVVIGSTIAFRVDRERAPASPHTGSAQAAPRLERESAIPVPDVASKLHDGESRNVPADRDFEREILESDDLWELAGQLLVLAKAGDGAAQFYLSAALSDCRAFDTMYFKDGNRRRTHDEIMQGAVQSGGLDWQYVSRVYKRCLRVLEANGSPFGTDGEWLKAATASGFPRAQAQTALEMAWKSRYEQSKARAHALHEDARRLAFEALRTKDPGALFVLGDAASVLDGRPGDENSHGWVWKLAACARGYDCSRQSAWYQMRCSYDPMCQPYENGVEDVARRETGTRFPELERRAQELNTKIDEGRFDELGI